MEILRCPNGHYYDPNQTPTCPKCAQEQGKRIDVDLGETVPATSAAFAQDYTGTIPIVPTGDTFPSNVSDIPMFVPWMQYYPKTEPIAPDGAGFAGGPKVEDYTATLPVDYGTTGQSVNGVARGVPGFKPVVGWMVCTKGNNKGSDYRIYNGYNYIGRAQSMDICIPGDPYISNERAAVIAYDDTERQFYFGPGMGHNTVRINGKMCLMQVALNPYDQITMGETTLLFVPFCGERFDWNDCK